MLKEVIILSLRILCIVKNTVNETIGYDVLDLNTNKMYENVEISKIIGNTLENASIVNGKYPFIRGNKALPTRIEKGTVILYHGSDHIVRQPEYGKGKVKNDYGQGFYTTMVRERAEEWALLMTDKTPICNMYSLNTEGLNIIDLDEYGPLAWIAEVLKHRGLGDGKENSLAAEQEFCKRYCVDTSKMDIIVGYRADDSYFRIIKSFVNNQITVVEVVNLFYKAKLGRQIFLKSEKCFSEKYLKFEKAIKVSKEKQKYISNNDKNARNIVDNFLSQRSDEIAFGRLKLDKFTFTDCLINNYKYDRERKIYYA